MAMLPDRIMRGGEWMTHAQASAKTGEQFFISRHHSGHGYELLFGDERACCVVFGTETFRTVEAARACALINFNARTRYLA